MGYQAPHAPVQAPPVGAEVWAECLAATPTADRATLCAMVKHLDAGIGRVLDALRAAGVWPAAGAAEHADPGAGAGAVGAGSNTVLIFTTDNGGAWFENMGCNYPLRGGKHNNFEGGVKGVGMIAAPGCLEAGTFSGLVHAVDWLPTIADATSAGLSRSRSSGRVGIEGSGEVPGGLDGVSIWPALRYTGTPAPRTEIVVNIDPLDGWSGAVMSIFNGTYDGFNRSLFKLMFLGEQEKGADGAGVGWLECATMTVDAAPADEGVVLQTKFSNGTALLFDLSEDPNEQHDLSRHERYYPPTANGQPPTANRQLPTANHQPPTANGQP